MNDREPTPASAEPYHDDREYHDDVDSLLAQLRDVEQALHSIRTNLIPLIVRDRPGADIARLARTGAHFTIDHVADAWAHPYHADQVSKLARAATSAERDAELIQRRYAATGVSP